MISSSKSSFISAFADELRHARDYSGITLIEVAAATHVSLDFLEALEAGRWEVIPQPYLRGFLSLYAKAVGMNVEKVVLSYDELVNAHSIKGGATLDSSLPLLRQPEHIGVTRAKIRTGWFTALSQHRAAGYLVFIFTLVALSTGLYFSRRAQRPHVTPNAFDETVAEYGRFTRGPYTHLWVSASDSISLFAVHSSNLLMMFAVDTGTVILSKSSNSRKYVRYAPFDTLLIDYDSLSYITITPSLSAILLAARGDTLRPKALHSDSAIYELKVERMRAMPHGSGSDEGY